MLTPVVGDKRCGDSKVRHHGRITVPFLSAELNVDSNAANIQFKWSGYCHPLIANVIVMFDQEAQNVSRQFLRC